MRTLETTDYKVIKPKMSRRLSRWVLRSTFQAGVFIGLIAAGSYGATLAWAYAKERTGDLFSSASGSEVNEKDSGAAEFLRLANLMGATQALPTPPAKYSRADVMSIVFKVAEAECRKAKEIGDSCMAPAIVASIIERESNFKADAIGVNAHLIGRKFKPLAGEGALSQAINHLDLGVSQISWGNNKKLCEDLLIKKVGVSPSLYVGLLDPETNIKCAIRVLSGKYREHKQKGAARLFNAVGCYNGRVGGVCNPEYARDVLNIRLPRLLQEIYNG